MRKIQKRTCLYVGRSLPCRACKYTSRLVEPLRVRSWVRAALVLSSDRARVFEPFDLLVASHTCDLSPRQVYPQNTTRECSKNASN